MLISVSIANFRSIHARQDFTMYRETRGARQAAADGWARPELLPAAALYGPNAAGKSTFVLALSFLTDAVRDSYRSWPVDGGVSRTPFALDAAAQDEPSEFDVEFVAGDGDVYRFGFAVDDHRVVSEYLHRYRTKRKTILYERTGEAWRFGASFRGPATQIRSTTRPNSLFISAAAAGGNDGTAAAYDWLVNRLHTYGASAYAMEHGRVARRLQEDPRFRTQLLAFLGNADLGVIDIHSVREELEPEARERLHRTFPKSAPISFDEALFEVETTLTLTHRGGDTAVALPFEEESDGTQALISFASVAVHALERGAVCVVDEIDSSLHPLLVAELVRIFADPRLNPKQAQLIFTTHDVSLLRPAADGHPALPRDAIWVVEKDHGGASNLVALSEYAPRTGDNLERGYLTGRYGGLPVLSIASELLGTGA